MIPIFISYLTLNVIIALQRSTQARVTEVLRTRRKQRARADQRDTIERFSLRSTTAADHDSALDHVCARGRYSLLNQAISFRASIPAAYERRTSATRSVTTTLCGSRS
jgi:hypothetical protein